MVRHLFLILAMTFSVVLNGLENVQIQVEVQDQTASENQPLFARIIVSHPAEQKVDESSFSLDGKPIQVQSLGHNEQSSITMINGQVSKYHQFISFYVTEIPPQAKGQHLLGSVAVRVGQEICQSAPVRYDICSAEFSPGFKLQAFVDAPKTLYPGQTFTATYRIITEEPMEWVHENLPLLDLKDFRSLGKRSSRVYYQHKQCIQEISQTYEVKNAGSFQVESSSLDGRVYAEDFFGRRRYAKEIQRAQADPISVVVQDFPLKDKPSSFNGAIGHFSFNVTLDSNHQVYVGDKLKLKLTFYGDKGLSTIHLPPFSEQVGFKDQFRVGDLPISTTQKEGEKTYISELRPMHENILEIPSITFSYFDPDLEEYKTLASAPISLTVLPLKSKTDFSLNTPITVEEKKELETKHQDRNEANWVEQQKPSLIDIEGVFNIDNTHPYQPTNRYEKEIIFTLILLWLMQFFYKRFTSFKEKALDSAYYLQQAFQFDNQLHKYPFLIEKALLLKLQETRKMASVTTVDQLPQEELCNAVKEFVHSLQMQLFAKDQNFSFEKSCEQAKLLYKKIGESA